MYYNKRISFSVYRDMVFCVLIVILVLIDIVLIFNFVGKNDKFGIKSFGNLNSKQANCRLICFEESIPRGVISIEPCSDRVGDIQEIMASTYKGDLKFITRKRPERVVVESYKRPIIQNEAQYPTSKKSYKYSNYYGTNKSKSKSSSKKSYSSSSSKNNTTSNSEYKKTSSSKKKTSSSSSKKSSQKVFDNTHIHQSRNSGKSVHDDSWGKNNHLRSIFKFQN